MVVHYTNAIILYLMPFIGAWGLPPPVERCLPALVVYLYPAMFGIAQGAPTPGCMSALVTFLRNVPVEEYRHDAGRTGKIGDGGRRARSRCDCKKCAAL